MAVERRPLRDWKQSQRPIAISTVLGRDVILLRSIRGREELSRPFEYQVELLSEFPDIRPNEVLGTQVSIRLSPPHAEARWISGFVSAFERQAKRADSPLTPYRATLSPWLWLMSLNRDCRIFQQKSVLDITEEVLGDFDCKAMLRSRLTERHAYRAREFCVQYRESSANFIQRLLEDEGIYYYFAQGAENHLLVLCDSPAVSEACRCGPIEHRQAGSGWLAASQVWDWSQRGSMRPTEYESTDFNFIKPRVSLLAGRSVERENCPVRREVFDYPGGYFEPSHGEEHFSRVRMQELITERDHFTGTTNAPGVAPGGFIHVRSDPFTAGPDTRYVITAIDFEAHNDDFETSHGPAAEPRPAYQARVRAILSTDPYRPRRITPRPTVAGSQTAIVTGRESDRVCIDRHARIKVHFHWDRHGLRDEKSSCWIRVSQAWAGKGYGWLALPRVGHEVIVDFLEGNPDRPIVTGRVYNGDNMPPISVAGKDVKHKPVKNRPGVLASGQLVHAGAAQTGAADLAPRPEGPVQGAPAFAATGARRPEILAASGPSHGPVSVVGVRSESVAEAAPRPLIGTKPVDGAELLGVARTSVLPEAELGPRTRTRMIRAELSGPPPVAGGQPQVEEPLPKGVTEAIQHTTFKSDSLDGADGSNEISINDSGAKEGLYFHAQYNEVHVVGNDRIDQVGKNAMLSTGENKIEDIGLNAQETVGVSKVVDVGTTLVIKAGTSITLQCGASTLHMNQAGMITLSGTVINIAGAANCNMAAPITSVTGGLLMMTNGMLNMVNGGFLANVNSGGNAAVKAGGDALVQGAKVKLN